MKKSYFICAFVAIFFIACAPQVTVTSEVTVTLTSVPTPTLHPQFIALQESIAAPGGRFTLQADGLIYDSATPIPGITVAPDGAMSLEVNGETITLDPADVDFDDEKGISIGGYEWDAENGEWVEAESAAMQQTTALIEQYKIDPETVTVTEEGHLVKVTDNETGKVLIQSNGVQEWYGLEFAADTIAANSCESTPFIPTPDGRMSRESGAASNEYTENLLQEFNYLFSGLKIYWTLVDRENQCWAITDWKYLFFRDGEKVAYKLPLISMLDEDREEFKASRADK